MKIDSFYKYLNGFSGKTVIYNKQKNIPIYFKYIIFLGEKTTQEFSEKFGKNRVHFIKCNVLEKDDIVNLYEVVF